jgi:hypothetical protein
LIAFENVLQSLLAILEDPFDIAPNKKPVNQRPASRAIANLIQTERSTVSFLEGVRVMP